MNHDKRTDRAFGILYTVVWPFFNFFRPVRAIGRENIPDGPAVLCPNHTSNGDPFYVLYAFGRKYPMRAMAKIELMRVPLIGWFLSKAGVFGVDRSTTDLKAISTAMKCLKAGNKLLIFPEGTRVGQGETIQAKAGAALFATRTQSPLLPIYIPVKKRWFRPNTVVIGKPYYPEFSGHKPTTQELHRIAQDLMDRIGQLGEGR